jgi:hypothetical protein
MAFTCPECESDLVGHTREIELQEGEVATVIGDRVVISDVVCSNSECDNAAPADEEKEDEDVEHCGHEGCDRPKGHTGRHRKPKPAHGE